MDHPRCDLLFLNSFLFLNIYILKNKKELLFRVFSLFPLFKISTHLVRVYVILYPNFRWYQKKIMT